MSADSIVPEPGNPQDLNRYAYVRNNPIINTDSSGHCIDGITTIPCILGVLAVANALALPVVALDYGLSAYSEPEYFGLGSITDPSEGGFLDYVRDRGAVVWGVTLATNVATVGLTTAVNAGGLTIGDRLANGITSRFTSDIGLRAGGRMLMNGAINSSVNTLGGIGQRLALGQEDFLDPQNIMLDSAAGFAGGLFTKGLDETAAGMVRTAQQQVSAAAAQRSGLEKWINPVTVLPDRTSWSTLINSASRIIGTMYLMAPGVRAQ